MVAKSPAWAGLRDARRLPATIAAVLICRHLRIGAERHFLSGEGFATRQQLLRRFAFFLPVFQRGERVEIVIGLATAAVVHARHHEQAAEAGRIGSVLLQCFVPRDLVFGGEDGVGNAGNDDEFAAARLEAAEVGADGVVERAGLLGFWRVAVEVEFF